MIQTKATITGCIGVLALAVALFSPTKEITNAESLVGFASGNNVETQTVQTNKGLMGLMFLTTAASTFWTFTSNDDSEAAAPVVQNRVTTRQSPAVSAQPARSTQPLIAGDNLNDFWEQAVEFAAIAQQFDIETRSRLLKAALVAHEDGWILRLLHWPVLLVIGRPGSAKSSFSAALGITREVLNPAIKNTVVTDPNAHLKLDKGVWQAHWNLRGSRDNWKEIGSAINDMYIRFADSQGANHISSIYDEVTTYKGNVDDKKLGGFLSQVTSKARACSEYITIVAHNDTLKALGGEAGEAKLKDDMAQLNLGSRATKTGLMVPTGTGAIEGLDVDERNHPLRESVTLPRWFDPEILSELFPELYGDDSSEQGDGLEDGLGSGLERFSFLSQTTSKPPLNHEKTNDDSGQTMRAVRIVAARDLQGFIMADLSLELEVSVILAAMDALPTELSQSRIVKEVMGCTGHNYNKGKDALEMIQRSIKNNTED